MAASVAILVSACGGGTSGGTGPSTPASPPAISLSDAQHVADAFYVADNQAQQALDVNRLATLEEGDLAIVDSAEFLTTRGHQRTYPPFKVSGLKVIVPASAQGYPADFLAEVTTTSPRYPASLGINVFVKDSASAPWRASAGVSLKVFPDLALDASGYATELTAQDQKGLVATGLGMDDAYCNYVSQATLGVSAITPAPSLKFAPGPNTDQYVASLNALFNGARQSGGTVTGRIGPETFNWVYRTKDGGAAVLFTVNTSFSVSSGGGQFTVSQAIDNFIDPGKYTNIKTDAENFILALDPVQGSSADPSVPAGTIGYTSASAF